MVLYGGRRRLPIGEAVVGKGIVVHSPNAWGELPKPMARSRRYLHQSPQQGKLSVCRGYRQSQRRHRSGSRTTSLGLGGSIKEYRSRTCIRNYRKKRVKLRNHGLHHKRLQDKLLRPNTSCRKSHPTVGRAYLRTCSDQQYHRSSKRHRRSPSTHLNPATFLSALPPTSHLHHFPPKLHSRMHRSTTVGRSGRRLYKAGSCKTLKATRRSAIWHHIHHLYLGTARGRTICLLSLL